jgi:uncharacterized protein YqiB (DUF1249 family)
MIGGYSSESIAAQIFQRLLILIPDLFIIYDIGISEIEGQMPLDFEVLLRTQDRLTIRLSHRVEHESGHTATNPEMTVAIHVNRGMAEALTYRDAYMIESVYSPDKSYIDILAKRVWNDYLYTWLGNLIAMGHSIKALT